MYQDFLDERQKYRQYRNKKQPVNRYGRPNIVRQDTSAAQKYITQQNGPILASDILPIEATSYHLVSVEKVKCSYRKQKCLFCGSCYF